MARVTRPAASLRRAARAALGVAALAVAGCEVLDPVAGSEDVTWVDVTVGGAHACALEASGRVACWGANGRGQAGTGTGPLVGAPAWVAGAGLRFTAVSAGDRHTCAVDRDGAVWCWGANEVGQLGDGTTVDRETPFLSTLRSGVATVSAGFEHTCAVRAGGEALCWGATDRGQSGWTVQPARGVPPGVVEGGLRFGTVTAGGLHTCGIAVSGAPFCWGGNDGGALGNGVLQDAPTPVRVSTRATFRLLAAGAEHTCGVNAAGQAWCWGRNDFGQSGDGAPPVAGTPVLLSAGPVSAVGAGDRWSCAIGRDRSVRCWGVRWDVGGGEARPGPAGGWVALTPEEGAAERLSVGARHACALTTASSLVCWGRQPPGSQETKGLRIP